MSNNGLTLGCRLCGHLPQLRSLGFIAMGITSAVMARQGCVIHTSKTIVVYFVYKSSFQIPAVVRLRRETVSTMSTFPGQPTYE